MVIDAFGGKCGVDGALLRIDVRLALGCLGGRFGGYCVACSPVLVGFELGQLVLVDFGLGRPVLVKIWVGGRQVFGQNLGWRQDFGENPGRAGLFDQNLGERPVFGQNPGPAAGFWSKSQPIFQIWWEIWIFHQIWQKSLFFNEKGQFWRDFAKPIFALKKIYCPVLDHFSSNFSNRLFVTPPQTPLTPPSPFLPDLSHP